MKGFTITEEIATKLEICAHLGVADFDFVRHRGQWYAILKWACGCRAMKPAPEVERCETDPLAVFNRLERIAKDLNHSIQHKPPAAAN